MNEDTSRRVQCNTCGTKTFHQVLFSKAVDRTEYENPEEPGNPERWDEYELLQCRGCHDICLWHQECDVDAPDDWTGGRHVYPPRLMRRLPRWYPQLPGELAAVLNEVYTALAANCRQLAAIGARTLIEMVVVSRVGDVGSFADRLRKLADQGFIERTSIERLMAALEVGHAAAHRGHVPASADLVGVIDIVENLLEAAYHLDAEANRLKKTTPRRFPRGI